MTDRLHYYLESQRSRIIPNKTKITRFLQKNRTQPQNHSAYQLLRLLFCFGREVNISDRSARSLREIKPEAQMGCVETIASWQL
jgi:hypothetical protein